MRFFKPNVQKLQQGRNVDGLIKALTDPEVEIREGAARALGELGVPRVVPSLCTALKDKEWTVLLTVIEALSTLNDPRAIEHLVTVLNDKRPAVPKAAAEALVKFGKPAIKFVAPLLTHAEVPFRLQAALILGDIGDPSVLPQIVTLISDKEWTVREAAAQVLGKIGDKEAVDPLSEMLLDTNPKVSAAATQALQKIGLPTDPASRARFAIAKNDFAAAIALGAPAVEVLISTFSSPLPDLRSNSARALGQIADPRALEPLITLLNDPEWSVREAAAWAIGRTTDARAITLLSAALKSPSLVTREGAAKAFSQMVVPDVRAIPPLVAALADEEYTVGESAAFALSTIGADAVIPLINAYKDCNSAVRNAIANALEKVPTPSDPQLQAWLAVMHNKWARVIELGDLSIEPLIVGLRDDDHRVRKASAEALGQIASIGAIRAIEPLCNALRDRKADVRKAIADILITIGQPALDSVIYVLNDPEWSARQAAVWVIGQIGDEWSVGPLCDVLRDPDGRVAEAAAEALDKLGLPEDPEVEAWHAVAKKDWQRAVGLGGNSVEALCIAVNNPVPDVRWAASRALGMIGDKRATDTLFKMLKDDEVYVRDAASDALMKLGYTKEDLVEKPAEPVVTEDPAPTEATEEAEVAE